MFSYKLKVIKKMIKKIVVLTEVEYAIANIGNDKARTYIKYIKEITYLMYQKGIKVSFIAQRINKSKSTVYKYIQGEYDSKRYPIIKAEIKKILLQGDFKQFIQNLSYKDLSLLRRKFGLWGTSKQEKLHSIQEYFKSYSILGVYPENLSKAIVKSAFKKKAKETHPDLNKHLDKSGKEFQEVYSAYTQLVQIYV